MNASKNQIVKTSQERNYFGIFLPRNLSVDQANGLIAFQTAIFHC